MLWEIRLEKELTEILGVFAYIRNLFNIHLIITAVWEG